MKLEKLFTGKNQRLYKIDGNEISDVAGLACPVQWSAVEPEPESYDEAYLALLRDQLKAKEDAGQFVFIEPVCDKAEKDAEQFTAAMKHCARRIKDCVSVIGFAIPEELSDDKITTYIEELSAKHAHYVYFSRARANLSDDIVLY